MLKYHSKFTISKETVMKREFLTSEKIFLQPTKFADLLVDSSGYVDLHEKLSSSD